VCAAKAALDGAAARALRPEGVPLRHLALVPLKDLVFGLAWSYGLVRRDVEWRGTRLRVARGTRIAPPRGLAVVPAEGVDTPPEARRARRPRPRRDAAGAVLRDGCDIGTAAPWTRHPARL
jgi:hypothetical protein